MKNEKWKSVPVSRSTGFRKFMVSESRTIGFRIVFSESGTLVSESRFPNRGVSFRIRIFPYSGGLDCLTDFGSGTTHTHSVDLRELVEDPSTCIAALFKEYIRTKPLAAAGWPAAGPLELSRVLCIRSFNFVFNLTSVIKKLI